MRDGLTRRAAPCRPRTSRAIVPVSLSSLVTEHTEPFTGRIDLDAFLERYPPHDTIKGMFFGRLVETLGGVAAFERQLRSPPKLGRYVPFVDYPLRDYMFLTNRAVEKRYGALGPREGLRRLARDDLAIFGESVVGRIMLEVAGNAHATLMATPRAYAVVSTGLLSVTSESLGVDRVRLVFRHAYGAWEYTVGQVEGMCAYFGAKARCTVTPATELPPLLTIDVLILT